jgi:integrase
VGKRANGEGTVFQIKKGAQKGRWIATLTVGRDASGKRVRRSKVARSQASAIALLAEMRDELTAGVVVLSRKPSVGEFLDRWLDDVIQPSRSDNYAALCGNAITKHIKPQIGGVRLDELSPLHVSATLTTWRKSGVGARTQQVGLATLSRACNAAVGMGLIRHNPCAGVARPKNTRKAIDPFTADEAKAILTAARGSDHEALVVLAFTAGLRISELFGLRWSDIDMAAATVRIERQAKTVKGKTVIGPPKTKRSIRTVELTPLAVAALVSHRKEQLRQGRAGSSYVFTAPRGGLLSRNNFAHRVWRPLLREAGVRFRTPHNTRHTYATLALGAGVPAHVVSAVMGHARASITQDVYAHMLPTHQAAATQAVAKLLG